MTEQNTNADLERAAQRVATSFAEQAAMQTLGATVLVPKIGEVEVELPFSEAFTQQHGFVHGGIIATVLDSACGYAALTTFPSDTAVLTVEYKINLVRPARGNRFVARGRVVRTGRTLTLTTGDVTAYDESGVESGIIAVMQATMMTIADRPELRN